MAATNPFPVNKRNNVLETLANAHPPLYHPIQRTSVEEFLATARSHPGCMIGRTGIPAGRALLHPFVLPKAQLRNAFNPDT